MPALIFLGRKWLIACDDFVVPGAIEAFIRGAWCIVTFCLIWLNLHECKQSLFIDYFLYAVAIDLFIVSFISACTSAVSARGSILEVEKRKYVSLLLYTKLVTVFCDICLASYGTWLYTTVKNSCTIKEAFIKSTVVLAWIYVFVLIVGIFICYDNLGSSKYWNVEDNSNSLNFFKKAQYTWKGRLKFFCCCADISEDNDQYIYVEISSFLASFLKGIDLVPTDILGGIITLSQKQSLGRTQHMLTDLPESVELLERTPIPDWMTLSNASYFLRIAKSTYGWIAFFNALTPWKLCRLSSEARCCQSCYAQNDETTTDSCCSLNLAAVKKISGFKTQDILYASFKNSIYEPAFFIAVNHEKKYIIIAIRGTGSFSDLVTDIDAEDCTFPLETQYKFKCHRGALRSAMNLQKTITELNILEQAFAEYPSYTLALTGHSLGASTACLLSLFLLPKYPTLQCYCYSPLAAVSASGIEVMLGCVLTVVVGDDMSPRMCSASCKELRKQIVESLMENKTPKHKLLSAACWYHVQKYFKNKPSKMVQEVYENKLCNNGDENITSEIRHEIDEDGKLYAAGRILYFETNNWKKPYWLTGLNLQNIIIHPNMLADHQPHKIQSMLDNYVKSLEEDVSIVIE